MVSKKIIKIFILYIVFLAIATLIENPNYIIGLTSVLLVLIMLSFVKVTKTLSKILLPILELIIVTGMVYFIYATTIVNPADPLEMMLYYQESVRIGVIQIQQSVVPVVATTQINLIITSSFGIFGVLLLNSGGNKVIEILIVASPGIFGVASSGKLGNIIVPLVTLACLILILLVGSTIKIKDLFRIIPAAGIAGLALVLVSNAIVLEKPKEEILAGAVEVKQVGIGADPIVSMRRSLLQSNSRIVLDYKGEPSYFKVATLNYFDGENWESGLKPGKVEKVFPTEDRKIKNFKEKAIDLGGEEIKVNLYQFKNLQLPAPEESAFLKVNTAESIKTFSHNLEDNTFKLNGTPGGNLISYTITLKDQQKLKEEKGLDAADSREDLVLSDKKAYLQVPSGLGVEITELAKKITVSKLTSEEKIQAIVSWFKEDGGFIYSTGVIGSYSNDPLTQFIKEKIGYCEQYAGASAILARLVGVPSRIVVGYTQGEYNEINDNYVVKTKNAHAWVEFWLEGKGWVSYDPTPTQVTDNEQSQEESDLARDGVDSSETFNERSVEVPVTIREERFNVTNDNVETSNEEGLAELDFRGNNYLFYVVLGVVLLAFIFAMTGAARKKNKLTAAEYYRMRIGKKLKIKNGTPAEIGEILLTREIGESSKVAAWVRETERQLYFTEVVVNKKLYKKLSMYIMRSIIKDLLLQKRIVIKLKKKEDSSGYYRNN